MDKNKSCIIVLALLIAFIAYSIAQTAQDTADINNVFELVVNNTDLYPSQRTNHTVYWANGSPIAVYIIFHSLGTGAAQSYDSNFTINGSVVLDRDTTTSAGSGFHSHWSFYTIVPKGANYSIQNSSNVFQIEWREYPILSGKNGTLSINQSFVGSSFNSTYDATTKAFNANYSAQSFPNSTYSNASNISTGTLSDSRLNGSVLLNYTPHYKTGVFTRDTTVASGTQAVTGIGFKPSSVTFFMAEKGTGEASWGTCTNGQAEVLYKLSSGANYWENSGNCIFDSQTDPTTLYAGVVSGFDSDGFTVTWTKTGTPTGTLTIVYTAYR